MWARKLQHEYGEHMLHHRRYAHPTFCRYMKDLDIFLDFMADRLGRAPRVSDITAARIELWLTSVPHYAPRTVARILTVLRQFCRYALRHHHLRGTIPTEGIRGPKCAPLLPRPLAEAELLLLLQQPDGSLMGTRDLAYLNLMAEAGFRAGEIAEARVDDVKWNYPLQGVAYVYVKGKGKEGGAPVISSIPALKRYMKRRPEILAGQPDPGFLFLNVRGQQLNTPAISMRICKYARRLGFVCCSHRLRHTAATLMQRYGGELRCVQQVLRHEKPETTARYSHCPPEFVLQRAILCHPLNHSARASFGLGPVETLGSASPEAIVAQLFGALDAVKQVPGLAVPRSVLDRLHSTTEDLADALNAGRPGQPGRPQHHRASGPLGFAEHEAGGYDLCG